MGVSKILVHTATVVRNVAPEAGFEGWVGGDRGTSPVDVISFKCCLLLPTGTENPAGRGRTVSEPTLLFIPRVGGEQIALTAKDDLRVVAPEQNVHEGLPADAEVRWQVISVPQGLGRPGRAQKVTQVTLRRIDD